MTLIASVDLMGPTSAMLRGEPYEGEFPKADKVLIDDALEMESWRLVTDQEADKRWEEMQAGNLA